MSATYIPQSAFHAHLNVPSEGDRATALSVNATALQFLGDNAQYLYEVVRGAVSDTLIGVDAWDEIVAPIATGVAFNGFQILGQSIANRIKRISTIVPGLEGSVSIMQQMRASLATNFAFDTNTGIGGAKYVQTSGASVGELVIPLGGFARGFITGAFFFVRGDIAGGGIHSALPGTMPTFEILEQTSANAPVTSLGAAVDPSPTTTVYDASHAVTLALGTPAEINPLSTYYARIRGEAGANAQNTAFGIYTIRLIVAPLE